MSVVVYMSYWSVVPVLYAIFRGLLKRKFPKVELAPGPPLSQIATGAFGSTAGYIQKNIW